MKYLYCLLLCLAVGATAFANNNPENDGPGPKEEKRLKIKIPYFGSGGMDMNSGKICPDRCFLCHCATVEIDLFKASANPPDVTGETATIYYEGEVVSAVILKSGPLLKWTDSAEYDYYVDKNSSESVTIGAK
ncbi:MAG: hypothetical protein KDC66_05020 [Phaeodactylibacter sp.]|nr:hypothetical protein [Phaeodactylibacter sp.]MCB9272434.1 hypothetical protein [Lewinellaceae bacterium]